MKKFLVIFILVFVINIPCIYAQYGDYYDGTNSYDYDDKPAPKKTNIKAKKTYVKKNHYIGISPSVYIPTGDDAYIKKYTGVGGGVDLRYQYNLHKIFALGGTFRYNYAVGTDFYNGEGIVNGYKDVEEKTEHHLMDFQLLAILQYDDVKATKGFIPYIFAGMDIAISIVDVKSTSAYKFSSDNVLVPVGKVILKDRETSANIGFVVGGGLRYAFSNNFTTGFGVDYTHVFTNHNYSGVRVFIDAGYRF